MATITLTDNGDWFAVQGDHKTSILSFNALGNFGGGSLVGTTTQWNDLTRAVTFRDGGGTQVEITQETQFGISTTAKDRWYIFTLQGSTGASVDIDYTGNSVSIIKTNKL